MASSASRKERERRRRAKMRKKLTTTAIIMLIIGIVIGYLANDLLTEGKFGDKPVIDNPPLATAVTVEELPVTPEPTATAEPTAVPTEVPTEAPTEAPTAEPVVVYVEVTPVPTEVPTEAPTEVPTVVPTAVPTEVPTVAPTATAEPTAVPTAEPTAEPQAVVNEVAVAVTAEPTVEVQAVEMADNAVTVESVDVTAVETTAEPVAEEAKPVVIPFGHSQTFETQITADGKSRQVADDQAYETLNLTLTVSDYKDHQYYVDTYTGKYKIKGDEAALEFKMTLNDYAGVNAVQPQEFLLITFCNEAGEAVQGYQITDKEIAGQVGVTLMSDVTTTMYKRYPYNAEQGDMEYMVVTAYNEGEETVYWFQMTDPVAEAAEEAARAAEEARIEAESTMTVGSQGENVKKLQQKLIELNLLSGSPDGKFGKYTAEAVKVLQGRYGMEQTGITSKEFLDKLYE